MIITGVRRTLLHSKAKVTTTTLDPANRGATQTLSNGNLTDTGSATGSVRSIANHSSGKYYCEITCGTASNTLLGICNAAKTLSGDFVGSDVNSLGVGSSGTWIGGTVTGTTTAPAYGTAGHVYGLAVDMTNKKVWIKDITAAGNWNANGTADPATNVNGAGPDATTTAGAVYFAISCNANGDNSTINFGATAYTGTPPSGFGNW